MMLFKNKEKDRIKTAIADCIESIRDDVLTTGDERENKVKAEAIYALVVAFNSL